MSQDSMSEHVENWANLQNLGLRRSSLEIQLGLLRSAFLVLRNGWHKAHRQLRNWKISQIYSAGFNRAGSSRMSSNALAQ